MSRPTQVRTPATFSFVAIEGVNSVNHIDHHVGVNERGTKEGRKICATYWVGSREPLPGVKDVQGIAIRTMGRRWSRSKEGYTIALIGTRRPPCVMKRSLNKALRTFIGGRYHARKPSSRSMVATPGPSIFPRIDMGLQQRHEVAWSWVRFLMQRRVLSFGGYLGFVLKTSLPLVIITLP
ncbi:hypothetical protein BKA70DRAFT_1219987 [Coprinopsis sp. MPI-PUGE-AT-0042]|nr:hypothetical protein BKA70DRAFT_1219987 [Coprinopsis sp. MPI-PUGE-AT-0042]